MAMVPRKKRRVGDGRSRGLVMTASISGPCFAPVASPSDPGSPTPVNPLVVTTLSLDNGATGSAYSETLEATGGVAPYTWDISVGSLPTGISLDANTGALTGTPTTTTGAAVNFTVRVTDDVGTEATKALSITVTATRILDVDSYRTGLLGAYSLRKLRTAYSGNCVRVWRSSDSTTTDVGFTAGGAVDTAAINAFVGASDGLINIWYDQSGNGDNVSQGISTTMPTIRTGSVTAAGIDFDGSDDELAASNATDLDLNTSTGLACAVWVDSDETLGGYVAGKYASATARGWLFGAGASAVLFQIPLTATTSATVAHVATGFSGSNEHIYGDFNPSTDAMRIYRDGSLINSNSTGTSQVTNPGTFQIGSQTGVPSYLDGRVYEVVVWDQPNQAAASALHTAGCPTT